MKMFVPQATLISVYNATVQPHFDYCSLVWDIGNAYSLEKLQKMQNRAARVITGKSYEVSERITSQRITSERIVAEFEHVIQSNQEFRLNDTVEINLIHVSMPMGGERTKRSEMNLKKHLQKKKSIIRIQNEDDLCMARAAKV